MLSVQASVAIIAYRCLLTTAGRATQVVWIRWNGSLCRVKLPGTRNLVSRVVAVDCYRVRTTALPVQNFGFHSTAKHVAVDFLLSSLWCAAINGSFISKSNDFAARASAT